MFLTIFFNSFTVYHFCFPSQCLSNCFVFTVLLKPGSQFILRITQHINFYCSPSFFYVFYDFSQSLPKLSKLKVVHISLMKLWKAICKKKKKKVSCQKRKQIIYSWSANIVSGIRFIVLPISKKFCHKSRRRSYLEFIRIAFRYAQIFFRYEPVSFLFRFMWVFFAKSESYLSSLTIHRQLLIFSRFFYGFWSLMIQSLFSWIWFIFPVFVYEDTKHTHTEQIKPSPQARSQRKTITFWLFS